MWLALLPEEWTTHNTAFWDFFPQADRLSPCPIPPSLLSRTRSALSIIRLENLIEHEIKSSWWPPPPAFTFPTQFSMLCWMLWKLLGLIFYVFSPLLHSLGSLCIIICQCHQHLAEVIQLLLLKPQAPLHLSTSPYSPHTVLFQLEAPSPFGPVNLFILSVKIILCCFLILCWWWLL